MRKKGNKIFYWIPYVFIILSITTKNLEISDNFLLISFLIFFSFFTFEYFFKQLVKLPFISDIYNIIHYFIMYKERIFQKHMGLEEIDIVTDNCNYIIINEYQRLKEKCQKIKEEYNRNIPKIVITNKKSDFYNPIVNSNPLGVIFLSEEYLNKGYGNFILGHELYHFFNKDHLTKMSIIQVLIFLSLMSSLYFSPNINLIILPIISLFVNIFSKYLERKSEFNADLFGKENSSKKEGVDFFNYLYFGEGYFFKESIFNTHPNRGKRINNLENNSFKNKSKFIEPSYENCLNILSVKDFYN